MLSKLKEIPRGVVNIYAKSRQCIGFSDLGPRKRRHYRRIVTYLIIIGVLVILLPAFFSYLRSSILSLLSLSLAIVSISLAIISYSKPEHWYPEDVEDLVVKSQPEEWEYQELGLENGSQYVYRPNRDIVLKYEPYGEREEFEGEDWVSNYMDSTAYKRELEITHRGRRLDEKYIVLVDGGKVDIPMPSRVELELSEYEYELGRILNCTRAEGLAPDFAELDSKYHQALFEGDISEADNSFEIAWNKREAI